MASARSLSDPVERLPVVLGSLVPFSTRRHQESPHRRFGMVVAHDQLLKHLLLGGVAGAAHMFSTSVLPRQFAAERAQCEAALDEMFSSGRRPEFRPLTDLPAAALNCRYCFLSTGAETQRLGQVRWSLPDHQHSIVTVVHAVNWMDAVANYLGLAATSEPQDTLVATSRAAESAVRGLHAWAAAILGTSPRARLVRIPLGVELPPEPAPGRAACRNALGLPQGGDILLYIGRLTDEYKADLRPVLLAVAALRDKYPALSLVVAGHDQGQYGDRIRVQARSLGIGARVSVIEDPAEPTKELLLGAADVFVSPADNIQESFGLALLEAMAHRLPVIASDWSGYRDIVADGRSGFLVPTLWSAEAGDAASIVAPLDVTYGVPHLLARHSIVDAEGLRARVDQLVGDPVLRRTMGDHGRSRVANEFSWASVVDQYRELVNHSPRQPRRAGRSDGSRASRRIRRGRPLPFNDVFGHYASSTLNGETVVQGADADIADPTGPASSASAALWTKIRSLENLPMRMSELQRILGCTNQSPLIGLIKEGKLRLVKPN